jgi:hypothetical protein
MIQLFLFAWLAGQAATSDAMRHVQTGLEARQQHHRTGTLLLVVNMNGSQGWWWTMKIAA